MNTKELRNWNKIYKKAISLIESLNNIPSDCTIRTLQTSTDYDASVLKLMTEALTSLKSTKVQSLSYRLTESMKYDLVLIQDFLSNTQYNDNTDDDIIDIYNDFCIETLKRDWHALSGDSDPMLYRFLGYLDGIYKSALERD